MKGTYLGCDFSNEEIVHYLRKINASFETYQDKELFEKIALELEGGKSNWMV